MSCTIETYANRLPISLYKRLIKYRKDNNVSDEVAIQAITKELNREHKDIKSRFDKVPNGIELKRRFRKDAGDVTAFVPAKGNGELENTKYEEEPNLATQTPRDRERVVQVTNQRIEALKGKKDKLDPKLEQMQEELNTAHAALEGQEITDANGTKNELRQIRTIVGEINNLYINLVDPAYRSRMAQQQALRDIVGDEHSAARSLLTSILDTQATREEESTERAALVNRLLTDVNDTNGLTKSVHANWDRIKAYLTKYPSNSESLFLANKVDPEFFKKLFPKWNEKLSDTKTETDNITRYKQGWVSRLSQVMNRNNSKSGLVATIPNLIQFLVDKSFLKKLLPEGFNITGQIEAGLQSFKDARDEFNKVLHDKVLGNFTDERYGGRKGGIDINERNFRGPIHLLRDTDGRLPSNVVTSMTAAITQWMSSTGIKTVFNDDKAIEALISQDPSLLSPDNYHTLQRIGTLRTRVVTQLGNQIFNSLGLQDTELADGYFKDRMVNSLGLAAIATMEEMGMVETENHDYTWFDAISNENKNAEEWLPVDPNKPIPFVRVRPVAEDRQNVPNAAARTFANIGQDIGPVAKQIFSMDRGERRPTEKAQKSPRRIPGSQSVTPEAQAKKIDKGNETPIQADLRMIDILEKLDTREEDAENTDPTFLQRMLKWKDPETVHSTQKASQDGINMGIDREIEALRGDIPRIRDTDNAPFFDRFLAKVNGRQNLESNTINYQTSKLHRSAYTVKAWESQVKRGDDSSIDPFLLAVGFGISGALGKENVAVDKNTFNDVKPKVIEIMNSEVMRKGWQAIQRGEYTDQDKADILAAVAKGGEGAYTLNALQNWAQYNSEVENSNGSGSFISTLPMEVDGLTNGLAISLFQIPATDPSDSRMRSMFNRVGAFFKGQGWNSVADAKKNDPGFLDNYQDLTKRTALHQQDVTNLSILRTISTRESQAEAVGDKGAIMRWQAAAERIAHYKNMLPYIAQLMPELIDQNQDVTKEGRNFGKDPVLQTNYGAGFDSIERSIGKKPIDNFYNRLMDIVDGDGDLESKIQEINLQLSYINNIISQNPSTWVDGLVTPVITDPITISDVLNGQDSTLENLKKGVIAFQLPADLTTAINHATEATYGIPASLALSDMLGPQLQAIKKIRDVFNAVAETYANVWKLHRQKWIEEHNGQLPTTAQEKLLIQELRNEGLLPSIRSADGVEGVFAEYLDLSIHESQPVPNEGAVSEAQVRSENKNYSQAVQREVPKGAYSDREGSSDLGSRSFVLAIQHLDGKIISDIYSSFQVFHVFDAYMSGSKDIYARTKQANELFLKAQQEYNLAQEVLNMGERVQKALLASKHPTLVAYRDQQDQSLNSDTLAEPIGSLRTTNALIQANRTKLFNTLQSVNQFSLDQGHADATAPAVLRSPESTDSTAENFEDVTTVLSNSAAGMWAEVQDRAGRNNLPRPTEEQRANLNRIMERVITPAMAQLDAVKQVLRTNPDATVNEGYYDGNEGEVVVTAAGNAAARSDVMPLEETFVHEYVHTALQAFMDDKENFGIVNQVEKIYNQARNYLTPEMVGGQRYWDHMFNNKDPRANLHEFMAIVLTNPKVQEAMRDMPTKSAASESNNWFYKMLGFLSDMARNFFGKHTTPDQQVMNLAEKLANVNLQRRDNMVTSKIDKPTEVAARLDKSVKAAGNKVLQEIANIPGAFGVVFGDKKANETAQGYIKQWGKDFGNAIERAFPNAATSGVKQVWSEFASLPKEQRNWRSLLAMTKSKIDEPRKRISDITTTAVKEAFDPDRKLTDDQWEALTAVVLKLDLGSLLGVFTPGQIMEFVTNPLSVDAHITEIEQQLKIDYGPMGNAYRHQARGLGEYMNTSLLSADIPNQLFNAHDIAQGIFLKDPPLQGDLEKAERQIDVLATLHGIKFANSAQLQSVAEIMRHESQRPGENNGVNTLMLMNEAFKAEALEKLFHGNKTNMAKGYVSEEYDPNVSIEVATLDDETQQKMKNRGYELVAPLENDPRVPIGKKLGLYKSELGIGRYRSGAVSLVDTQFKGTDITDQVQLENVPQPRVEAARRLHNASEAMYKDAQRLLKDNHIVRPGQHNIAAPVIHPETKKIVGYRYVMSEANKKELLKKKDLAHQALGKAYGSIYTKAGTRESHKAVAQQLIDDYAAHRKTGNFVTLSPNSNDPKLREMYAQLPRTIKMEYSKRGGDPQSIPVRKNMVNYAIGMRDVTIAGTLRDASYKGKFGSFKIPNVALVKIRLMEDVWKDIVAHAKARISILLPDVVIGNAVSNGMLLLASGIPPTYIAKKGKEAVTNITHYQRTQHELQKLGLDIGVKQAKGVDTTKEERRYAHLQERLTANPVHELMEEGLLTAIAEDVSEESFRPNARKPITALFDRLRRKLGDKISEESKLGKVGKGITKVASETFMTPGSDTFAASITANQIGDYVGRYVKYNYEREQNKKSHEDALNEARDDFIMYDENQNKFVQFADDYGFYMFAKYFHRIQRVMFRVFANTPVAGAAVELLDRKIDHPWVQGAGDYFLNAGKAVDRVNINPFEKTLDAFDRIPLWEWLKIPYNMLSG